MKTIIQIATERCDRNYKGGTLQEMDGTPNKIDMVVAMLGHASNDMALLLSQLQFFHVLHERFLVHLL